MAQKRASNNSPNFPEVDSRRWALDLRCISLLHLISSQAPEVIAPLV